MKVSVALSLSLVSLPLCLSSVYACECLLIMEFAVSVCRVCLSHVLWTILPNWNIPGPVIQDYSFVCFLKLKWTMSVLLSSNRLYLRGRCDPSVRARHDVRFPRLWYPLILNRQLFPSCLLSTLSTLSTPCVFLCLCISFCLYALRSPFL